MGFQIMYIFGIKTYNGGYVMKPNQTNHVFSIINKNFSVA